MPTLVTKRGKRRYLATSWYKGIRGPSKLMPDDSKKSYRLAITWERDQVEALKEQWARTATDCLTVEDWSEEYLNFVQSEFVKKTYDEKFAAFKRFVDMECINASTPVADVTRFVAASFLNGQAPDRTGNAINKDRKNMAAAWKWGRDNLEGFPQGVNPFQVVAKKKEVKQPRYVPPMDDFWAVYDLVAAKAQETGDDRDIQDRVMLLAYLHLAARRSELFKAKWSDVDFNNCQIRLGTHKRGCGFEYDWLPMTDELQAELMAWRDRRQRQSTMDDEHIFVCLTSLPCCDPYFGLPFKVRRWAMGTWCKRAKVKAFGWHAIRHLTALELYRKGYPVNHIQLVLRHRMATTTNIYLRSLAVGPALRTTLNGGLSREKVIPFSPNKTASSGRA